MAWPVYSERFFKRQDTVGFTHYQVPTGRTAIIRNVVACNVSGAARALQVTLAGASLVYLPNLAASQTVSLDLYQVAYADDTMSVYTSDTGLAVCISGYLLTGTNATTKPGDLGELELPRVDPFAEQLEHH